MRLRYSLCSRVVCGAPLGLLALFVGLFAWARPASASCTSPNMCIPPVSGCAYTSTCDVLYPMGYEIKNLTLYEFASCVTVQPGQIISASLQCKMDVDLSEDAGVTWLSCLGIPTTCTMMFSGNGQGGQGEDLYLGTIVDLSAAGGGLPAYVGFRESPIQNSTGSASVHATTAEYQIDSFFDVFTELTLDGGMTWYPGLSSCRIVLNPSGPTPVKTSTWGQLKVLYR